MIFRSFLVFTLISGIVIQLQVDSRIIFDRIDKLENENYSVSTYCIDNSGDISYLNINVSTRRRMNLKMTIKTDVYALPNTRQPIIPIPRINFCDLAFHSQNIPFLSDIYLLIEKYGGKGLTRCPIEPGNRTLRNVHLDVDSFAGLSAFRPGAKYMAQLHLRDENGKKPVLVFRYRVYVTFK